MASPDLTPCDFFLAVLHQRFRLSDKSNMFEWVDIEVSIREACGSIPVCASIDMSLNHTDTEELERNSEWRV